MRAYLLSGTVTNLKGPHQLDKTGHTISSETGMNSSGTRLLLQGNRPAPTVNLPEMSQMTQGIINPRVFRSEHQSPISEVGRQVVDCTLSELEEFIDLDPENMNGSNDSASNDIAQGGRRAVDYTLSELERLYPEIALN